MPRPPIASLAAAVEEVRSLYADYKYFEAGDRLDDLRRAIAAENGSREAMSAKRSLDALLADGQVEKRVEMVRSAQRELNQDEGWNVVRDDEELRLLQTVTDDQVLMVKIDSVLEGVRPADTLMVWREAKFYPKYARTPSARHSLSPLFRPLRRF